MGELALQTVAAGPLLFPVATELTLEPNENDVSDSLVPIDNK